MYCRCYCTESVSVLSDFENIIQLQTATLANIKSKLNKVESLKTTKIPIDNIRLYACNFLIRKLNQ